MVLCLSRLWRESMGKGSIMTYKINCLQNTSNWDHKNKPTIVIKKTDTEWESFYINWIAGKNPTDYSEWEKGVFAIFSEDQS